MRHGGRTPSPSAALSPVSSPSAGADPPSLTPGILPSALRATFGVRAAPAAQCLSKARWAKKKGHPADAPSAHPAIAPALLYLGHPCPRLRSGSVRRGRGFDGTSMYRRKRARFRQLLLHCSTSGIHALACAAHGCARVFRRHMDVPSENPGADARTRSTGMCGGRGTGGEPGIVDAQRRPGAAPAQDVLAGRTAQGCLFTSTMIEVVDKQRKVSRAPLRGPKPATALPKASVSARRGEGKETARSRWIPAFAGMTIRSRELNPDFRRDVDRSRELDPSFRWDDEQQPSAGSRRSPG
jgi:hypothetical protein